MAKNKKKKEQDEKLLRFVQKYAGDPAGMLDAVRANIARGKQYTVDQYAAQAAEEKLWEHELEEAGMPVELPVGAFDMPLSSVDEGAQVVATSASLF